jgi:hypothetical protein
VRGARWFDLRLLLGVLLVLGSVLLGARVVGAADTSVPVWAAAGDLTAGTVLGEDDLVAVDVRLDSAAAAYLSTSTRPAGRALARAVRAGELLPRSALDAPADLVSLALPVQAGYVPPSLARGQLVDVYAVPDPAAGGAAASGTVTLVAGAVPVQAVSGRTEGVLSAATTTVQVVVSVPPGSVAGVLGAIAGRAVVVVQRGSVDGAAAPSVAVPSTAVPSVAVPSAPAPTTVAAPSVVPAPVPAPVPAGPTA